MILRGKKKIEILYFFLISGPEKLKFSKKRDEKVPFGVIGRCYFDYFRFKNIGCAIFHHTELYRTPTCFHMISWIVLMCISFLISSLPRFVEEIPCQHHYWQRKEKKKKEIKKRKKSVKLCSLRKIIGPI